MNFFSLLFLFAILKLSSSARNWFGLKKDDKEIKEDCEPKILTIRKTKVIPVAVPVYQKKNVYSIDLMKNEIETNDINEKKKPDNEESKDEIEDRSNNVEEKNYYSDYYNDFEEDILKKNIYDDDEDLGYLYSENF